MSEARFPGIVLVASFLAFLPGAILYVTRDMSTVYSLSSSRIVLERSFLILGVIVTSIGLLLAAKLLATSPRAPWVLMGALIYLFASILIVTAELAGISQIVLFSVSPDQLQRTYVMLAFLSQALIGFGLANSPPISTSIGWICFAWNAFFLFVGFFSGDLYIPVLHHFMPLLIGVNLLSVEV